MGSPMTAAMRELVEAGKALEKATTAFVRAHLDFYDPEHRATLGHTVFDYEDRAAAAAIDYRRALDALEKEQSDAD